MLSMTPGESASLGSGLFSKVTTQYHVSRPQLQHTGLIWRFPVGYLEGFFLMVTFTNIFDE